jgi:tRNA(fMet)-specific endonuclease VapC
MKNVLIDTNIYSLAMKGDKQVIATMRRLDRIGFSAISIAELFSGFKGRSRENRNRQELEQFLDSPRVVVHVIDEGSADFYAAILNNLRAAGTPIPTNDIWIAATAFQHGYKLYSKDEHFRLIPGLVQFRELQG